MRAVAAVAWSLALWLAVGCTQPREYATASAGPRDGGEEASGADARRLQQDAGAPDAERMASVDAVDAPASPGARDAGGVDLSRTDTAPSCATDRGMHLCRGACVANDEAACGPSCTACVAPRGGTVTCDGTACKAACPAPKRLCDTTQACIDVGEACANNCPVGRRICPGGTCKPNDAEACGASCVKCVAPAGGTVACDGTKCNPGCPAGTRLCESTNSCIAPDNACDGMCPAGRRLCGGAACKVNNVDACGSTCVKCAAPAGGTVSCDGTKCVPACPSNMRFCEATNSCIGAAQACGSMCPAGSHACSGVCKADDDVDACGPACTTCPSFPNSRRVCQAGACDYECTDSTKPNKCPNGCFQCCQPEQCPARANHSRTCTANTCGYICSGILCADNEGGCRARESACSVVWFATFNGDGTINGMKDCDGQRHMCRVNECNFSIQTKKYVPFDASRSIEENLNTAQPTCEAYYNEVFAKMCADATSRGNALGVLNGSPPDIALFIDVYDEKGFWTANNRWVFTKTCP